MISNNSESKPRLRWLNRTVLGIGLASLFSDFSHEVATALLPTFLATMGVAAAWLGIIEGVSDGLSSVAKMGSGFYTDKLQQRKPIAVLGYVVGQFVLGWYPNGMHYRIGLGPVTVASVMMIVELVPGPLQILSVKVRKKKIFPYTPIHHAFEKAGWPETRVVFYFALAQLLLSALAVGLMVGLPTMPNSAPRPIVRR